MHKFLAVLCAGGALIAGAWFLFPVAQQALFPAVTLSDPAVFVTHREYAFHAEHDTRFTFRAFAEMQNAYELLSEGSTPEGEVFMHREQLSVRRTEEGESGVYDRYSYQDDIYELRGEPNTDGSTVPKTFRVTKNNETLFVAEITWGSNNPIWSWKIVNEKPAFLFSVPCVQPGAESTCATPEIWYDGAFVSQAFSLTSPQYIFTYKDRVGFVARTSSGVDGIFYNGAFLAPEFDNIWNANCCAASEILPTVYQNGTLLFYAIREGVDYLVEVSLPTP